MSQPEMGQKPRRNKDGPLSHRRPYLSAEDLSILQQLQLPGETPYRTLRRVLREALARKPVEQALRGLEARLARIEAAGARGVQPPPGAEPTAADDRGAIERVRETHLALFKLDDDA